jgi:hypothetical protein
MNLAGRVPGVPGSTRAWENKINDYRGVEMKKSALLFLAIGLLLSGCVVYDEPRHDAGMHRGERDREADRDRGREHQRERDGVPDRFDRRPDDRERN